ncbi:uncharacterized protein LOC132752872 [Ruditapes philippinarum]|uniref:uncharacterized protein LOC132752872 n=1 Tax=Ruditapes philippinarum TaxID=129788 RepID=UPI00295AF0B1|nr:uncharacterized protein LOC132752872 [Ruditapes philippinarum]
MGKTFVLLFLALFLAAVTAQIKPSTNNSQLNLPKLNHKEFSWNVKPLFGSGKPNGLSGTGTWRPANTGNMSSATGSLQSGSGFGGGVKGTFGIGKESSISLGIGEGGGKEFHASLSARIRFRRKRRSEIIRKLYDF